MKSDYKKYSLEQLENWVHDAISAAEASPEEIYGTIKKVVEEQYYYHKHQTSQAYELLALLNGNPKMTFSVSDIPSYEWNYDYSGPPVFCTVDDSSSECKNAWNDFWSCDKEPTEEDKELCKEYAIREQEYCDDVSSLNAKVTKWVLPVEVDGLSGECYVTLPDDLLEAASLKEGDQVEWIDNGDESFIVRKINGIV